MHKWLFEDLLAVEGKMKRISSGLLIVAIISGAVGIVIGHFGIQYPAVANADYCVEIEWCTECTTAGCPSGSGKIRCRQCDGWYPTTGVCCLACGDWELNCHYPY